MLAGGCDDLAGGAWLEPDGTGTTGPPCAVPDIIPDPGGEPIEPNPVGHTRGTVE